MAKMFGKRERSVPAPPQHDPISSIAAAPLPRHAGPPASSTPLADQLAKGGPGVNAGYVVLPRSLAEQMPLPWQQQLVSLLAQFHQAHRNLSWPLYRVLPSREEKLVDLDEEQLAEAGYLVEIDSEGEMVYRERNGRKVDDPENTTVLVSCLDPIVVARRGGGSAPVRPESPPDDWAAPLPRTPAPMNIGPQPVWSTVPDKAASPPGPPRPAGRSMAQEGESRPVDWFAATPDAGPAEENGPTQEDGATDFGPTGDPIERPYRQDS